MLPLRPLSRRAPRRQLLSGRPRARAAALRLPGSTATALRDAAASGLAMSKETKKPFRQSVAEWRQFIYNPNSGEFLGRTAKSWGERGAR